MYEKPTIYVYKVCDLELIKAAATSTNCTGGSVGINSCQLGSVGVTIGCTCGPGKSTCHGNATSGDKPSSP